MWIVTSFLLEVNCSLQQTLEQAELNASGKRL